MCNMREASCTREYELVLWHSGGQLRSGEVWEAMQAVQRVFAAIVVLMAYSAVTLSVVILLMYQVLLGIRLLKRLRASLCDEVAGSSDRLSGSSEESGLHAGGVGSRRET